MTTDTKAGQDLASGRNGPVRLLVGVQLYVLAAYLAAAIVPYLWRHRAAPPTWTWIGPGWALGMPGFWVTLLGPVLAVPLALAGLAVAVLRRNDLPPRLWRWCTGAAVATLALAAFMLTPLGAHLAVWVQD